MRKKKRDKQSKQLLWIVGIMAFIIIVISFIYLVNWKTTHFKYLDFKWEEIKYGQLKLYHTKILLTRADKSQFYYNLYLRHDPRTNNIPINANIRLKAKNYTYITIDPKLEKCIGLSSSLVDLGGFLAAIGVRGKTALINESYAEEKKVPYITCNNKKLNSIITLEETEERFGNYSQILQEGDCFQIKIKDCEVRESVERFMLGLIAYSKKQRI